MVENFADKNINNVPDVKFHSGQAADWQGQAEQLADWTRDKLVNRYDAYGAYYPGGNSTKRASVTDALLRSHYCGTADRVGLHCYGTNGRGKWVCIDIDAHDGPIYQNWADAVSIMETLDGWGVRPLVEHSNGQLGFHLWVLFDDALPLAQLRSVGLYLLRDVEGAHEVFPKQFDQKEFGNYVRLPGRHHKHLSYWSEVYDLDAGAWRHGADAVRLIVSHPSYDPALIPAGAKAFNPPPAAKQTATSAGTGTGGGNWSSYDGDMSTLDIVALSADRLRGRCGDWQTIVCPWADQHTTGDAAYVFEAEDGKWPRFCCHHSHCRQRTLADYLASYPPEEVDSHCGRKWRFTWNDEEIARIVGYYETAPDPTPDPDPDAEPEAIEELIGTYDGLEMLRRAEASQTTYLFDGLLESGVITLFSGLPYSGKSMVVLQAIRAVALGEPFCGRKCLSPHVPVLYINADRLRDAQFVRRLRLICEGDEAKLRAVLPYLQATETADLPATVSSPYVRRLVAGMKKRHRAKTVLVVIDTLRPALLGEAGAGAENDAATMTGLLSPLRELAGVEGVAIWLLHHNNKGRDEYSGNSAIAASTEAVWTIRKKHDSVFAAVEVESRDLGRTVFDVQLGPSPVYTTAPVPPTDALGEFIAAFPTDPPGWTRGEVERQFSGRSEATVRRNLEVAVRDTFPRLVVTGTGRRGDPYRYLRDDG